MIGSSRRLMKSQLPMTRRFVTFENSPANMTTVPSFRSSDGWNPMVSLPIQRADPFLRIPTPESVSTVVATAKT